MLSILSVSCHYVYPPTKLHEENVDKTQYFRLINYVIFPGNAPIVTPCAHAEWHTGGALTNMGPSMDKWSRFL